MLALPDGSKSFHPSACMPSLKALAAVLAGSASRNLPPDERIVAAFPQIAGEIKDFDPGDLVDKKSARRLDLVIKYILVAGKKVPW